MELRGTSLHHLDDFSFAFPFRLTDSPRMITSKLRFSLQHLALHASEISFRFLHFKTIDHCLPMARFNGRAKQVEALRNQLTHCKHKRILGDHKYFRKNHTPLMIRDPSAMTFGLADSFAGGGASKPSGRPAKKSSKSRIGTSLEPLPSP